MKRLWLIWLLLPGLALGQAPAPPAATALALASDPAACTDGQFGVDTDTSAALSCQWIRTRTHATDCTSLTDGLAGELCCDIDDGACWRCEPSAGDCDTVGEWIAVGGGGTPTAFLDGDTGCTATDATPDVACQVQGDTVLTLTADGTDVNGITIDGGATGLGPTIGAGGETNVDINFAPAGTGELNFTTTAASRGFRIGMSWIGNWTGSPTAYGGLYFGDDSYGASDYVLIYGSALTVLGSPGTVQLRAVDVTYADVSASGFSIVDGGTKPTCDATSRGAIWLDEGGAGVADTSEQCLKDGGGSYAWGAVVSDFKGSASEKDVDGTPASTITVAAAGTYYPWITSTAGVLTGVTADSSANATCTALDDPYACCTGSGTGTCGDLLIPSVAGDWMVSISMSYSGTNSSRATCCAFVNDAAPTGGPCFVRKLGTGGDVGSASSSAALALSAGDEVDLRCTADNNGDVLNIWTAHLTIEM